MNIAWHIGLMSLWLLAVSYFRYRAARAEMPDKKLVRAFMNVGGARANTVEGRRYRACAWAALIVGAALFFFFPLHPCNETPPVGVPATK
jgi:hypothetical protein